MTACYFTSNARCFFSSQFIIIWHFFSCQQNRAGDISRLLLKQKTCSNFSKLAIRAFHVNIIFLLLFLWLVSSPKRIFFSFIFCTFTHTQLAWWGSFFSLISGRRDKCLFSNGWQGGGVRVSLHMNLCKMLFALKIVFASHVNCESRSPKLC